jgi:hypothetical protein
LLKQPRPIDGLEEWVRSWQVCLGDHPEARISPFASASVPCESFRLDAVSKRSQSSVASETHPFTRAVHFMKIISPMAKQRLWSD